MKEKHPLTINKVETAWIECLNTRPEGEDRTKEILAACMECVRVCEEHYVENNLHLIRPLYTAYTATIHDTQEAKNAVSQKMIDLQVDDKSIQDNQYIYKSQIVDIIMRIATGLTQQTLIEVMVHLQRLYEVQCEYCEGDQAHPFLEEAVSVQASFLERI